MRATGASSGGSRVRRQFSPAQVLVLTFAALIASGTILLSLPIAATGEPLPVIDALFTATSAVCVTGLIVVDTPAALSGFGQAVLLLLVQIGGLGYMAITTVAGLALGRQLTVHERLTIREALNADTMEGLARFVFTVLKLTLAFELLGAAVLAARWADDFGIGRAAYYGLFHAVSAFNNAGFSLFSDNLMRFRSDWVVNLVITTLIICGGLGFVVLMEIGRLRRYRGLSPHVRLVVVTTIGLIAGATALIWLVERHNPLTLGPLGGVDALLAAYFQAVSPRTAGFNTLDIGALLPGSLFLMIVLMFIGGAPGGTAGGVKTSTLGITVAVLWAMVRGAPEPTLMGRRITPALVARAFSICLLGFLALNAVTALLLIAERRQFLPTLFETASAFGTVGLSMTEPGATVSLTAGFSGIGKILVMIMMFMGRIGPLTLAAAVARRGQPARIRHPEGRFLIG